MKFWRWLFGTEPFYVYGTTGQGKTAARESLNFWLQRQARQRGWEGD